MDADARSHSLAAATAAAFAPPSVSANRTKSSPSTSSNGAISSAAALASAAVAGTCAHSATSAAHSVSGVVGATRLVAESARAPEGDDIAAYAEGTGSSAAAFSRRRSIASRSAVRRLESRLRACHHLARRAGEASVASIVASTDGR